MGCAPSALEAQRTCDRDADQGVDGSGESGGARTSGDLAAARQLVLGQGLRVVSPTPASLFSLIAKQVLAEEST